MPEKKLNEHEVKKIAASIRKELAGLLSDWVAESSGNTRTVKQVSQFDPSYQPSSPLPDSANSGIDSIEVGQAGVNTAFTFASAPYDLSGGAGILDGFRRACNALFIQRGPVYSEAQVEKLYGELCEKFDQPFQLSVDLSNFIRISTAAHLTLATRPFHNIETTRQHPFSGIVDREIEIDAVNYHSPIETERERALFQSLAYRTESYRDHLVRSPDPMMGDTTLIRSGPPVLHSFGPPVGPTLTELYNQPNLHSAVDAIACTPTNPAPECYTLTAAEKEEFSRIYPEEVFPANFEECYETLSRRLRNRFRSAKYTIPAVWGVLCPRLINSELLQPEISHLWYFTPFIKDKFQGLFKYFSVSLPQLRLIALHSLVYDKPSPYFESMNRNVHTRGKELLAADSTCPDVNKRLFMLILQLLIAGDPLVSLFVIQLFKEI